MSTGLVNEAQPVQSLSNIGDCGTGIPQAQ
jgi:hypothetical protein